MLSAADDILTSGVAGIRCRGEGERRVSEQFLNGTEQPPPQFSAHVYCGQMAGWINVPLGTEVGLSPGDIVLDADSALPKKGAQQPPPHCSAHVYSGQTAG